MISTIRNIFSTYTAPTQQEDDITKTFHPIVPPSTPVMKPNPLFSKHSQIHPLERKNPGYKSLNNSQIIQIIQVKPIIE
jgi:hypothetical protein